MKKLAIKLLLILSISTLLTFGLSKYIPNPSFEMQKANAAFSSLRVMMSTAVSASPGTSYRLDGTGDWLTVADNAGLTIGTGSYTIECWVRLDSLSIKQIFIAHAVDSDSTPEWQFGFGTEGGQVGLYFDGNSSSDTSFVIIEQATTVGWVVDTWYHVAMVRNGSDWQLYWDGVAVGSSATESGALQDIADVLHIGRRGFTASNLLTGNIDEIRISDSARWTTGFTPATAEYTSDGNTTVLIHCDETIVSGTTGSGATFTDSGSIGLLVTEVGDTIRSTTVAKF